MIFLSYLFLFGFVVALAEVNDKVTEHIRTKKY